MVERMKKEEEEKGRNWRGIALGYYMCTSIRLHHNPHGESACHPQGTTYQVMEESRVLPTPHSEDAASYLPS